MKRYGIALSIFALWLAAWIALSWPAIQDDALIHLRYADNLKQLHYITYNGTQADFGASSLLYVGILAAASTLSRSPDLSRFLSSLFHIILFCGLAWLFATKLARSSRVAKLSSLLLLALLVGPCAIRWLDDGMETGLVLCATSCLAWLAFDEARRHSTSRGRFAGLLVLAYLLVLLRSELAMLAGIAFLAIVAGRLQRSADRSWRTAASIAIRASHLLIGCVLASATVLLKMGVLLPDTAVAKAEGLHAWRNVLIATEVVLASSFSIGVGLAIFWLLTLGIVLLRRRLDAAAFIANTVFGVLLFLTAIRGQAVQGVRYLLWAMLFPAIWNILLLGSSEDRDGEKPRWPAWLLYGFALLLLIDLPFESTVMYRVLTRRASTMRKFEAQHLGELAALQGAALDIGYIGYFTHADVCDMSGLVNGRAVAHLTPTARKKRCADQHLDFFFGNSGQLLGLGKYHDLRNWRVCGAYDFVNVRTPDTHYLVADAASAERVCHATGASATSGEQLETVLPGYVEP